MMTRELEDLELDVGIPCLLTLVLVIASNSINRAETIPYYGQENGWLTAGR